MDNTIPALERAIGILAFIERTGTGATAADLTALGIPRTTLYRILRILAAARLIEIQAGESGRFVLGPAVRRMAASMAMVDGLIARAQPVMERLSSELGETIKVVVREGFETVAIAVRQPDEDSRIASRIGARLPLHVGAGQRLLLAHAPDGVVDALLACPLKRHGAKTIVEAAALRSNLSTLRRQTWALGRDEGAAGVGSIAALIDEPGREPRAALVALYILGGRNKAEALRMRDALVRAAREI